MVKLSFTKTLLLIVVVGVFKLDEIQ